MHGILMVKKALRLLLCAVPLICPWSAADAALSSNLETVIVYPSPFDVRLGHTTVTFDNLTLTASLRIYKITGELVLERDIETANGRAVWDLTNSSGERIASGLYLYVVTNRSGQKKTGKIAILR